MTLVVAIGYCATALNVAGNLLLAKMRISGWVVRLLTNVAYVVYAVQIPGGGPMVANHVIFFGVNIYGFWQWRTR